MQYPALPVSNDDIQNIVAICSLADVAFERHPDNGGVTVWKVWLKEGDIKEAWLRRVTVYGTNLRAWQAAIQEVLNQRVHLKP